MPDASECEYAGILWAVDGQHYYLYVTRDRQMVLAPVVPDE